MVDSPKVYINAFTFGFWILPGPVVGFQGSLIFFTVFFIVPYGSLGQIVVQLSFPGILGQNNLQSYLVLCQMFDEET